MPQTLVVGDIHGCFEEFQALLDRAGLTSGDTILSLGDFVDRGPETPAVQAFFRDTPGVQACMGNHERKHMRGAMGELRLSRSQNISKRQFGDEYPAAVMFMATLPLYIELPEALCVHAAFEPGLPLEQQKPSVLCGTMSGDRILQKYPQRWYELYDGPKPILVGHKNYTKTDQPFVHNDRVFGLDTACVTGKALTGLLLPAFRFVSVPSRGNLWAQTRRAYAQPPGPPTPPRERPVWTAEHEAQLEVLLAALHTASAARWQAFAARPDFATLTPRKQAKAFERGLQHAKLIALLQLARLGRLDARKARILIYHPAGLPFYTQMLQSLTLPD